ncbi:liprin-beta-2b isoform X1 [Coregonus clupeaformis]|uniref:liprin-beta-2b isoform X1 n=1 Tax=Coregonus clupeaformis TaxID=59861 RepID=UPI001BE0B6C4|nr:liprin-beta-2b isoform X1 [Coregonus clupeaformis]XP_041694201.1 liprin-beta-2b isoform X1 [Coregonus clupeaformis]XP_041694202.1 liprin-beta-2b isoform X1 [Coregonus clupeaformis]XP_041694203.1 liprin-beta-2b isoform X1 [Coregonus clupeaformis]XP_041694205.1 liprin-beta-2b isoform X1 [Coregonus clupeaformis]XP_041694206.1 liprin-beta-2b isoform X1 [Coregonus clupeaformis]
MASDASHMLEAALEQMDDIIAGSKAAAEYTNGLFDLGSSGSAGPLQVLQLVEDLRLALELQPREEERNTLRTHVPSRTAHMLMDWLDVDRGSDRGSVNLRSPLNNESYQERLVRLEGDKESLVLQVSVLTDQVEAQGEKIRDLESSLEEHHHKLNSTEEMLQQELLSRTSLETQKLDLMDEVSYLKLKLVGMDEEQNHNDSSEDQQNKAECVVNLISELQEQMCRFQEEIHTRIMEKRAMEARGEAQGESGAREAHDQNPDVGLGGSDVDEFCCRCGGQNGLLQELRLLKSKVDVLEVEKSQYERKLKATKTEISDLQQILASKDSEIEGLQRQLVSRGPMTNENPERVEVFRRLLTDKYQEFQRLKMGMETLLAANDEKDRHIEELTVLLRQYRKMKEVMALAQVSSEKLLVGSSEEELSGSLKMRALTHKAHSDIIRSEMSSRCSSPLLVSSSSFQKELDSSIQTSLETSMVMVSPSDVGCFHNGQWSQPRMLSSSLEELQSGSLPKHVVGQPVEAVSENRHMEMNKYQTLPGKLCRPDMNGDQEQYATQVQLSPDDSEDSELNLRKSERLDESTLSDLSPLSSGVDSGQQSPVSPENRKNHLGIKKLWGKIRRTQSGSLQREDLEPGEFKRGGLRATAGPRLARTGETLTSVWDLKTPFSKWTPEQVCCWLEEYGLDQYVILARHWANSGQTLLSASPHDLEKEMGIKNPLHRKKLQLALKSFSTKMTEKSSELDHIWVTRWLDDIGLPQYKGQFHEGRVDGRMLQYLTVNDLLFLKVTSQLHHLSVKCAIHVLHVNKFNPNCLKRRPGDENKTSPSEVVQWSNHRVMEWLRSVDLAEYAPNLRGSGVHGGLIILEPRFNSDTLAMLLNIPPQKTLLRRHLATNFNMLVGSQAQQEKREFMESSGYAPLSTTAKVRPKKLGFSNFGHLRKKRCDESTDYICPLEEAQVQTVVNGAHRPYSGFRGLSPILDRDPDRREQVGPNC